MKKFFGPLCGKLATLATKIAIPIYPSFRVLLPVPRKSGNKTGNTDTKRGLLPLVSLLYLGLRYKWQQYNWQHWQQSGNNTKHICLLSLVASVATFWDKARFSLEVM
jgi:hypothetical protein